jgi:hypothetical protein
MIVNLTVLWYDLKEAGLHTVPMNTGGDGQIEFCDPATPQATKDAVLAILAAHDPDKVLPDKDDLRDAYVVAKAAVQTMAANAAIPADARNAVVKLGLCLEELLKYLNRRIA